MFSTEPVGTFPVGTGPAAAAVEETLVEGVYASAFLSDFIRENSARKRRVEKLFPAERKKKRVTALARRIESLEGLFEQLAPERKPASGFEPMMAELEQLSAANERKRLRDEGRREAMASLDRLEQFMARQLARQEDDDAAAMLLLVAAAA